MIDLILVYCLVASPDKCLERREVLDSVVDMTTCTMRAQTSAQDYLLTHPLYRLSRWRCEKDKPREEPA